MRKVTRQSNTSKTRFASLIFVVYCKLLRKHCLKFLNGALRRRREPPLTKLVAKLSQTWRIVYSHSIGAVLTIDAHHTLLGEPAIVTSSSRSRRRRRTAVESGRWERKNTHEMILCSYIRKLQISAVGHWLCAYRWPTHVCSIRKWHLCTLAQDRSCIQTGHCLHVDCAEVYKCNHEGHTCRLAGRSCWRIQAFWWHTFLERDVYRPLFEHVRCDKNATSGTASVGFFSFFLIVFWLSQVGWCHVHADCI